MFHLSCLFQRFFLLQSLPIFNQARAHSRPAFLKLFYEKCACVYACTMMYVCMYACIFVYFPHPREQAFYWSLKAACIQIIMAKQNLCYTKLCLEGMFLSQSKTGRSDRTQTSKPAFLVDSSGILQPKNSVLGLMGLQGMRISSFGKWAWPILTRTKMKSSPEALLEEF